MGGSAGAAWDATVEDDSARSAGATFGAALSRTRGNVVAALNEPSIVISKGKRVKGRPVVGKYPPVSCRPITCDALHLCHVIDSGGRAARHLQRRATEPRARLRRTVHVSLAGGAVPCVRDVTEYSCRGAYASHHVQRAVDRLAWFRQDVAAGGDPSCTSRWPCAQLTNCADRRAEWCVLTPASPH